MTGARTKTESPLLKLARQHWPRLLVFLAILFVVVVRVRLKDMPLERDEGEYAYAGQLILQGIPPYKLACNMKLPGTYAAYAVIMAMFGQTPAGIHLGLALVNAACVLLVFLLGRKLADEAAGALAAVTFALMSLSPSVLGLAAHATHFVILPALGGAILLLSGADSGRRLTLFLSGLLFGLAFLMKQHGVMFCGFGLLYLAWMRAKVQKEQQEDLPKIMQQHVPFDFVRYGGELGGYVLGLALPYLVLCLVLWWAGVFSQFWFWTVTYAQKYISVVPMNNRAVIFRYSLDVVTSPNLLFWLLGVVGAILMWGDRRVRSQRVFLAGFFIASCLAISLGFYFREHYFILLLPALSLLVGLAVSRGVLLMQRRQNVERLLALPLLGGFLIGLGFAVVQHGEFWFSMSPVKVCRQVYWGSIFSEAVHLGDYVRTNTPPGTTVAILGSEPEIFFYSQRHSATRYIYVYSLMEPHPYALTMQEEMIREIESARPQYVLYFDLPSSWILRPESKRRLMDWWLEYWGANYDLVKTVTIDVERRDELEWRGAIARTGEPTEGPQPGKVVIFKRRPNAPK